MQKNNCERLGKYSGKQNKGGSHIIIEWERLKQEETKDIKWKEK
jgi:hypothetical protein